MKTIEQVLLEVQDKWGLETVNAIIKKLDSYPIKWRGTLRRSIIYEVDEKQSEVNIFMADYGEFVDKGVDGLIKKWGSPFRFRGRFAGTEYHIREWADSKGLNSWALAFKIQRDGIKPRPFFDSVVASRVPNLESDIDKAVKDYLDKTINNINNP